MGHSLSSHEPPGEPGRSALTRKDIRVANSGAVWVRKRQPGKPPEFVGHAYRSSPKRPETWLTTPGTGHHDTRAEAVAALIERWNSGGR